MLSCCKVCLIFNSNLATAAVTFVYSDCKTECHVSFLRSIVAKQQKAWPIAIYKTCLFPI